MTMTTFEEEIETRTSDYDVVRTLIHEDESRTFIYSGDYDDMQFTNPRDNDGNVLHLVSESRDYKPLDEADEEISYVRGLADLIGNYSGAEYAHMFPEDEDEFAHRMHAEGKSGEEVVQAYLDEFRPDIVYYVHEWSVQGTSQSDWQFGWAYMTRADYEDEGFTASPAEVAKSELDIFESWFRGEVYRAVHVSISGPEFEIGTEGGYYTGAHDFEEDHCGGFLGYDDMKQIAEQFTDSPVIEEVW